MGHDPQVEKYYWSRVCEVRKTAEEAQRPISEQGNEVGVSGDFPGQRACGVNDITT